MHTPSITRRNFLKGCCAAAAASAAGPGLFFSGEALAANSYDTLIHVFLRGAIDGLNLVVPISGADRTYYEQARPTLAIANSGTYGALPLILGDGATTPFGLHPSATGLRDLWNDSHLAIIHACGSLTNPSRSHFDAQYYIDSGSPGKRTAGLGWLANASLTQSGLTGLEPIPSMAVGARLSPALAGAPNNMVMATPSDFALNAGSTQWRDSRGRPGQRGLYETLPDLWGDALVPIEIDGRNAIRSLSVVAQQPFSALPASWPTGTFASQLWTVSQSIRFDLGLRYATVDLGGWDTHENQGTAGPNTQYYQTKIAELSAGLSALMADLQASGHLGRVSVVVQSEFGRRVRENAARGTDHGYANPLLVLGGAVNGRRLFGDWRGLAPATLAPFYGDVPATTDYRRVLSEILIRRMRNPNLGRIFPGYAGYTPMGIMQGSDLTPQFAAIASDQSAIPAQTPAVPLAAPVQPAPTGEGAPEQAPAWQVKGPVDRTLIRRGL